MPSMIYSPEHIKKASRFFRPAFNYSTTSVTLNPPFK